MFKKLTQYQSETAMVMIFDKMNESTPLKVWIEMFINEVVCTREKEGGEDIHRWTCQYNRLVYKKAVASARGPAPCAYIKLLA